MIADINPCNLRRRSRAAIPVVRALTHNGSGEWSEPLLFATPGLAEIQRQQAELYDLRALVARQLASIQTRPSRRSR